MKTIQFKTNINCDGCIAKVTPFIENEKGIEKWSVDTISKDKILTVETVSLTEEQVKAVVEKAGFKIKE
jgi:copper chaperone